MRQLDSTSTPYPLDKIRVQLAQGSWVFSRNCLKQRHAQCILDHLREQRKCHQVSLVGNQKQPPQLRLGMASWKSNLWPRQFLTSTTMDDPCFGHNSASPVSLRNWISKLLNFLLMFCLIMSLPKSCLNKFLQANGLIITNTFVEKQKYYWQ